MTTLISVFAVRFHVGEVIPGDHWEEETILGLASTVAQSCMNRGLVTIAVGMTSQGEVSLVFERRTEAGKALSVLSAVIDVLRGERQRWEESKEPHDPTLN